MLRETRIHEKSQTQNILFYKSQGAEKKDMNEASKKPWNVVMYSS